MVKKMKRSKRSRLAAPLTGYRRPTFNDLEIARRKVKIPPDRAVDPLNVAPSMCRTCPWRKDGLIVTPGQMLYLATDVNGGNQLCHSPVWRGLPETQVCRGHREYWKSFFFRQGLLRDLTDEAWAEALRNLDNTHEV